LERSLISERVRHGLEKRRSEGLPMGRPIGTRDKRKRAISGYCLRYFGKSPEQRRLGKRVKKSNELDKINDLTIVAK